MASNPVWEICERMAEVQALLDDHIMAASTRLRTELRRRNPR
jgi:hypothetical protein